MGWGILMIDEHFSLVNRREYVGRELGVSEWQILDQRRIDQFAECTGDHQWIHVDPERARRESPAGATIAHGYLTLSLIARTTFDIVIAPLGLAQAINYGIDRARFLAPVKVGARVRNRIRLIAVEDKGGGRTLLTTENHLEIEGEEKPALIAYTRVMVFGSSERSAREAAT
jgi:acyl dehydratase